MADMVPYYHVYATKGEAGPEFFIMKQVTAQRSTSVEIGPYPFRHQAEDVTATLNKWATVEL